MRKKIRKGNFRREEKEKEKDRELERQACTNRLIHSLPLKTYSPSETKGLWWTFFWLNRVGLPPAVLDQNILSKGVETGPTATQFGSACA